MTPMTYKGYAARIEYSGVLYNPFSEGTLASVKA